jgi:hypothetical protein
MIDATEQDSDNLYNYISLFSTDGLGLLGTQLTEFLGCPRSPSIGSSPSVAVPVQAATGFSQRIQFQPAKWMNQLA